ncbi:polysaccharide export protein [Salegentibacter sp. JZCK2]|uniref:polysaccharide biosynthesis/export family protein n=1 Tax=Salegentibacter tibetensis TaxID=2873600 RepID=UPI001CC968E6|nr:polysaccharide biosynthesis/export family protein [Salegentibacter tibetensis]MBZ9728629.1 polysaccharide export protein [Salegentibacter tibetensis]
MIYSNFFKRPVLFLLLLFIISSCVSRKEMVYFQDIEQLRKSENRRSGNNLEIQPDDVLTIRVSAPEQEAALPFNLTKSITSQERIMGEVELETYLVSNEGTIEFPVIGTIEVKGLTNIELAKKIQDKIRSYVKDPIVNVRILNFQISVLGEVNNPGTFSIEDDHITLSKALSMAGDLTIFGKRNNILVMGEDGDHKTYAYLDLTNANVVNSPHYNLRQNDVIYVEPRGTRRQSAGSTGLASTYLSIVSVLASLVILITK